MGKGAAVLLVTLTCVALLPRCHSQGEVRVTECKGMFRNLTVNYVHSQGILQL